jgi:ribonuclease Z
MRLIPIGYWAVPTAGETTCFLIEDQDVSVLLDTGMNPAYGLTKAGRRLVDVKHVFLSHCHADHLSGFVSFVFSRQVQERTAGRASQLIVLGSEMTIAAGQSLLKAMYPDRSFDIKWEVVSPSESIMINHYRAEFIFTMHTVPGLALRLIAGDQTKFAYTSDTASSDALVTFCRGAEMLLGECFGTEKDFGPVVKAQKHLSADAIGELAHKSEVKQLVLFHMHQPYRNPEKREELLAEVSKSFKGKVVFPIEGQAIESV